MEKLRWDVQLASLQLEAIFEFLDDKAKRIRYILSPESRNRKPSNIFTETAEIESTIDADMQLLKSNIKHPEPKDIIDACDDILSIISSRWIQYKKIAQDGKQYLDERMMVTERNFQMQCPQKVDKIFTTYLTIIGAIEFMLLGNPIEAAMFGYWAVMLDNISAANHKTKPSVSDGIEEILEHTSIRSTTSDSRFKKIVQSTRTLAFVTILLGVSWMNLYRARVSKTMSSIPIYEVFLQKHKDRLQALLMLLFVLKMYINIRAFAIQRRNVAHNTHVDALIYKHYLLEDLEKDIGACRLRMIRDLVMEIKSEMEQARRDPVHDASPQLEKNIRRFSVLWRGWKLNTEKPSEPIAVMRPKQEFAERRSLSRTERKRLYEYEIEQQKDPDALTATSPEKTEECNAENLTESIFTNDEMMFGQLISKLNFNVTLPREKFVSFLVDVLDFELIGSRGSHKKYGIQTEKWAVITTVWPKYDHRHIREHLFRNINGPKLNPEWVFWHYCKYFGDEATIANHVGLFWRFDPNTKPDSILWNAENLTAAAES